MKHLIVKPLIVASAIVLTTAVAAQASTAATNTGANRGHAAMHHARKAPAARRAKRTDSAVVTYERDSKDPNIGWHTAYGMRVCQQDCDNPEIPGSGYSCRNVQVFGMAMRE